jgi:hypothetical protein
VWKSATTYTPHLRNLIPFFGSAANSPIAVSTYERERDDKASRKVKSTSLIWVRIRFFGKRESELDGNSNV